MSFEENMTAFYMAFAEQKLDQLCQSLSNMRLVVQNDSAQLRDRAAAATTPEDDARFADDVAVREEMLHACEMKAQSLQEPELAKLKALCAPSSATGASDVDSVLNQFYLCAELGAAPAAAPVFTGYMSRTFKTQSRAVLDRVAAFKKTAPVNEHGYIERNFYVEAMSEIMTGATDVMNAVADVTPDVLTLRKVLAPIHEICSERTLEIVQLYTIDARMAAWERRALDQARRDPRDAAEVESDESLQMVDLFLDELSFIIRIIMGYGAFVQTICDGLDSANQSSGFGVKIQELNGVYLILERFYIFQSTHKATEIAEVQELESQVFVSSIVEDASFVLNKSFFRACQCMNYHTALSVVIALVDALESTYLPSIINLPNRTFVMPQASASTASAPTNPSNNDDDEEADNGVSFSDMLLAAVDDDLTKSVQEESKLIMAINSAFMSGEFIESLEAKIDEFCTTSFPHETLITECLPKPISELKESFRAIVSNEVKEVLTTGISKRMEPLVNRLMLDRIEYELTAPQYDAYGLHGSPLNKLVEFEVLKNKVLRRYQTALCASAFEDLVECFVQDLTRWLEASLVRFRKRFNDLGALQLEREITDMLDRVSQLVQTKSLRGSFTRLFQLVLIVNLMQPSEIVDYADSITTDLTLPEIETFLRMRVDFKDDDVRRAISALQRAVGKQ